VHVHRWQLGDCVEVFIKPEDGERTDYWEIHITPSGYIMDIHIKARGDWQWDEAVAQQSGAMHAVCMTERGWVAELRVPWSAFGMHHPPPAGAAWRINIGRYNITSDAPFDSTAFQMAAGGERELSASAPLTVGSFHNYEEFNTLVRASHLFEMNQGVRLRAHHDCDRQTTSFLCTGIRPVGSCLGGY